MTIVRKCLFVLTALGLLFAAGSASACPVLKKADPRVGSTVRNAPSDITLRFSGPVLLDQSTLTVADESGRIVSHGPIHRAGDDDSVGVGLNKLDPGRYKVRWTIQCNCEGSDHTAMPGDYSFTVGP